MVLILSIFGAGRWDWDPYSKFTIFFMDGWNYAEKVVLRKKQGVIVLNKKRVQKGSFFAAENKILILNRIPRRRQRFSFWLQQDWPAAFLDAANYDW